MVRLPKGIKALRGFEIDNGDSIARPRFEKLIDSLDKCAFNSNQKTTKCASCPYLDECLERFDAICDRVVVYRRKGKTKAVIQP